MDSRDLLERFDVFLSERGVGFEAIVVGGAALNLLGVISRATKDCDVLDPEIPPAVATAARAFAAEVRKSGETLQDDWLNNGPRSLAVDLPQSGESRSAQYLWEGSCGSRHLAARTCSE
jgi:hypothetical protein